MKYHFLFFFSLFCLFSHSQNEYVTKSNVKYKVSDTLQLGKPSKLLTSMVSSSSSGSWEAIFKLNGDKLSNVNFMNKKVIITKIEQTENETKFYFELFKQKLYVLIEKAILSGEVILPYTEKVKNDEVSDKYDKIKKIKELLDIGAITKEEFEIEKKKLLNSD